MESIYVPNGFSIASLLPHCLLLHSRVLETNLIIQDDTPFLKNGELYGPKSAHKEITLIRKHGSSVLHPVKPIAEGSFNRILELFFALRR
jgi:hypothetical protein